MQRYAIAIVFPSVRLSQGGIVSKSKRLNVGSRKQHLTIA